jgi:hypothetical protein
VSDRQWADIVGVLKAAANPLDMAYLEQWARALSVADILERARAEADG